MVGGSDDGATGCERDPVEVGATFDERDLGEYWPREGHDPWASAVSVQGVDAVAAVLDWVP